MTKSDKKMFYARFLLSASRQLKDAMLIIIVSVSDCIDLFSVCRGSSGNIVLNNIDSVHMELAATVKIKFSYRFTQNYKILRS